MLGLALVSACSDNSSGPDLDFEIISETVTQNPSGVAPLTALIELETDVEVSVSIRVAGINGPESDIVKEFEVTATQHEIPVLGLYPDLANTVELTFRGGNGTELGTKTYTINTEPRRFARYRDQYGESISDDRGTHLRKLFWAPGWRVCYTSAALYVRFFWRYSLVFELWGDRLPISGTGKPLLR